MEITIEVFGKIAAGKSDDDLVFKLGVNTEGATCDFQVLIIHIFVDGLQLGSIKLNRICVKTFTDSVHKTAQLV